MAIQTTELIALDTGSLMAELVFGSIDGIFSVLGIIAAGGAAALTNLQIFTTGMGGAAAGALSVFAATYLSETTEKKTRLLTLGKTRRISGLGSLAMSIVREGFRRRRSMHCFTVCYQRCTAERFCRDW